MKKLFFPLIITLFFAISPAFAEYSISKELAISEEKNQCGIHWSLLEYPPQNSPLWEESGLPQELIREEIPFGWKVYTPDEEVLLETPFGSCRGSVVDSPEGRAKFAQECCQKLDFEYIPPADLPHTSEGVIRFNETGWKCTPEPAYEDGIFINTKKGTCSALVDFSLQKDGQVAYPRDRQCVITDSSWKEYRDATRVSLIQTPVGTCDHFFEHSYPHEFCCEHLGLKYVGKALTTGTFLDLVDHWAHSPVKKLLERGIIEKSSYFFPDHFITRAEALKISLLLRGSQIPVRLSSAPFSDTPLEAWYTPYVLVGAQEGIIQDSVRYFFPQNPITRAEAIKVLAKTSSSDTEEFRRVFSFLDVPVLSWQAEFVAWAKKNGIAQGFGDSQFFPDNPVTRAEFAKMAAAAFGL